MKKIIALLLCAFALSISSYANNLIQKEVVAKSIMEKTKYQVVGRQCCAQSATDADGNVVTIEACAGWFLSNDLNAYARACDKALAALAAIVGEGAI